MAYLFLVCCDDTVGITESVVIHGQQFLTAMYNHEKKTRYCKTHQS